MDYRDYVNTDIVENTLKGWDIEPTSDDLSFAKEQASGWLEDVIAKHAPFDHSENVLKTRITDKVTCIIATNYLGGHVTEKEKPLFMRVCDSCDKFEKRKPSDYVNTIGVVSTRRGVPEI